MFSLLLCKINIGKLTDVSFLESKGRACYEKATTRTSVIICKISHENHDPSLTLTTVTLPLSPADLQGEPSIHPLHPLGCQRHDPAVCWCASACHQLHLLHHQRLFLLPPAGHLHLHHTQQPAQSGRHGSGVLHRCVFPAAPRTDLHHNENLHPDWSDLGGECHLHPTRHHSPPDSGASKLLPFQDVLHPGPGLQEQHREEEHLTHHLSGCGLVYLVLHLLQCSVRSQNGQSRCEEGEEHSSSAWLPAPAVHDELHTADI